MTGLPRGLRNANPGNIRHGSDWQGMRPVQTDPAFVQFLAPEWGIRALVRVLRTYEGRGLHSVRQIISRWAPPTENDTEAYITAVANEIGISPDVPIETRIHLPKLLTAIIRHENGQQPYSVETIAKGIALA